MLKTAPAVFAVGNTYQILVCTEKPVLFSVEVGGHTYYDASNGIMRSLSDLHRVIVPMEALDKAKGYTVCLRPIIERKPYFTETEEMIRYHYDFIPVPETGARAYHIADAHNRIAEPIRAAAAFGNIDFLILNGDILEHSGDPSKFYNIYEIAAGITHGEKPTVFSRGNHDLRGNYAERFADYTPNDGGNTYYTFRLGSIWGLVLDCGEDKEDDHAEYGLTIACHAFREVQTEFIRDVIATADWEYKAEGVKTRAVIVHNPFIHQLGDPFNIEVELFTEWATLLREYIKPDVMICGHFHKLDVHMPKSDFDHLGQPCPVVVGAKPGPEYFAGCGIVFGEKEITVQFTDSNGETLRTETIKRLD